MSKNTKKIATIVDSAKSKATDIWTTIRANAEEIKENTYSDAIIYKWLRTFTWRFFAQQFKRSCLPDGPKVGSVAVSPRGDLRMPSDASSRLWMLELDELKEELGIQ